jgi:hypothetical protein
MGISVQPGWHAIRFVFRDWVFEAGLYISFITIAGIVAALIYKKIFLRPPS